MTPLSTRPMVPAAVALPWLIALTFLAFQLARIITGIARGPSSSTVGLAYPFTVILAGGVWLVVFGLVKLSGGFIPQAIRSWAISGPAITGVLLVSAAVGGVVGHRVGLADVRDVVPVVLVDARRVEEVVVMPVGGASVPARLVLVGLTRRDTLTLAGHALRIEKDTNRLIIADADGTPRITIPLPALNLPLRVEVVPVRAAAVQPGAFAILVTGSMRSKQAMVAVVDSSWRLVYLERMYRRWPVMLPMLALRSDSATGRVVLIVAAGRPAQRGYRLTTE